MRKTIFPTILLLVIFLTSCGWDEVNKDITTTTTTTNLTNIGDIENKTTDTIQNNSPIAIPREDDRYQEMKQEEIDNMPQWAKDEMNIEEPKWLKFVEGISRDRWSQKSIFVIYSGDFNTLKKEGEKLAKKAWLKLNKDSSAPKDSVSYSNSIPNRQWETTDWSKYLKSIDILKAPDDDFDNIEDDYTLWISIMDSGLIKN